MPLFFFNIRHDDVFEADQDGMIFESIEDAREMASSTLRQLVADQLLAARPTDVLAIDIADSKGIVLDTVTLDQAVLKPLAIEIGKIEEL